MPNENNGFLMEWQFKTCEYANETSSLPRQRCLVISSVNFSVALVGNVLTLLALISCPDLRRLHNVSLASLAVADIFVVTIDLIYTLLSDSVFGVLQGSTELRLVYMAFAVGPMLTSALHVWGIAVERYIAIVYPFKFAQRFTKAVVVKGLCFIWGLSFLLPVLPIVVSLIAKSTGHDYIRVEVWRHFWTYTLTYLWVMYVGMCFELTIMYVQIFRVARKSAKMKVESSVSGHDGLALARSSSNRVAGKKAFFVGVAIVMACVVVWTPWFVTFTAVYVGRLKQRSLLTLTVYFHKLGVLNSSLNIFLYAGVSSEFRGAYKAILCRPQQTLMYWRRTES